VSIRGTAGLALAALLGAASCQTADPSPRPTSVDVRDWGPLAVIDEEAELFAAALGGTGRLRIGERCVTLVPTDGRPETTIIWRDSQASWDPAGRIVFEDVLLGRTLELRDGSRIEIGGAGSVRSPWLAPPHESCPSDRFVVHSLDLE